MLLLLQQAAHAVARFAPPGRDHRSASLLVKSEMRRTMLSRALQSCAAFARSSTSIAKLPPHKLMPMPRLSPTMTSGKVLRWRVQEGEPLPESGIDTIVDILPTALTDRDLRGSDDLGDPVLEIEAHEEGYLCKILLHEGGEAQPDEAIAVIVEDEADIDRVRAAYAETVAGPDLVVEPATFAWQAYLGEGETSKQCSNS